VTLFLIILTLFGNKLPLYKLTIFFKISLNFCYQKCINYQSGPNLPRSPIFNHTNHCLAANFKKNKNSTAVYTIHMACISNYSEQRRITTVSIKKTTAFMFRSISPLISALCSQPQLLLPGTHQKQTE